jgi:hypothetical protein
LYNAFGYDADVGKATTTGFFTGLFGAAGQAALPGLLGNAVGGAAGAYFTGGNVGEGALWGAASAVATGLVEFYQTDEPRLSRDGSEFGTKEHPKPPQLVVEEHGIWAALLGDPFSHAFVAFGDGTFADSQNCDGCVATKFNGTDERYTTQLAGNKYRAVEIDIDVPVAQGRAHTMGGQSYGIVGSDVTFCTAFARVVSGGALYGLMPGQMYFNASGMNVGYVNYSYEIYGRGR